MSLLDYVLGDRAGSYLLVSCLLVATLAIIAAIVDIPLKTIRDARLGLNAEGARSPADTSIRILGVAAAIIAFLGAAVEAFLASGPTFAQVDGTDLVIATDLAGVLVVLIWGLTPPLARHWGLCLGAFGLGLAALFLAFAVVLRLDFQITGTLASTPDRSIFAVVAGVILLAVAACLAAIVGLVAHIVRGAVALACEHRRLRWSLIASGGARRAANSGAAVVTTNPQRRPRFRRLRGARRNPGRGAEQTEGSPPHAAP